MKQEKIDEEYRLFSKVILIYFIRELRNITGRKVSYIEEIVKRYH